MLESDLVRVLLIVIAVLFVEAVRAYFKNDELSVENEKLLCSLKALREEHSHCVLHNEYQATMIRSLRKTHGVENTETETEGS